tara:strand:+ start:4028 stop:5338 length:1311 start_codon:yes stop_codon:yes gene_type:complete
MGTCHKGNPLVFEAEGVRVYAGGRNRGGGWHKMSPMPDLAMGPIGVINSAKKRDVLPLGWGITDTLEQGPTPTVLEIDWPDMGIPSNLGKDFWKALIVDIKVKELKSISCQCVGGHGRTGVQVAILAHLLIDKKYHEWETAEELILWVRKQYCENAVESTEQQTYISEVCNIPEGESAIVVTHTPWSNDFNASDFFTQDEIEAEERNQKRMDAIEKKPKRKATDGVEWANKPSSFVEEEAHYETPVVDDYSLTKCQSCENYEWRGATEEYMLLPCIVCDSSYGVGPVNEELMNEENQVQCFQTEEMWHEIEMYDVAKHVSFWAEAKRRNMKTRTKKGVLEVKAGHRFQPTFFLIRVGDEICSASDLHREKKKIHMEARKQEREAAAYASKLDEHSSIDSIYDNEKIIHSPDTQDKAVDMLRKRNKRPTNEEIESED